MAKYWKWLILVFAAASGLTLSACAPQKLFGALSPSYESQEACGFVQNVYGQRISWKGHLPIKFAIHESVGPEFHEALQAAMNVWELTAGKKLFEIVNWSDKGLLQPRQDGINEIYLLDTWESTRSQEQARTSVYWVGDQIREADIRLNGQDFKFYVDKAQNGSDVHFESLLVHELGHVLGLKHEDGESSVMGTYLAADTVRSTISGFDSHSISCEY